MFTKIDNLLSFLAVVFIFNLAYLKNLKLFNISDKTTIDKQQVQFIFSIYMLFIITLFAYIFKEYILRDKWNFEMSKDIPLLLFTMLVIFSTSIIIYVIVKSSETDYIYTNFDMNLIKYSISMFYLFMIFSFFLLFKMQDVFVEKDLIQRLNINSEYNSKINNIIQKMNNKFKLTNVENIVPKNIPKPNPNPNNNSFIP